MALVGVLSPSLRSISTSTSGRIAHRAFLSIGLQQQQQHRRFFASSSEHVFELTSKEDFKERVLNSKVPTILDCYADWCAPCKLLSKALIPLVEKADGKVKLAKANVDTVDDLASELQVSSIPAVFAYHKGKVVDKFIGAKSPADLEKFIANLASLN